MRQSENQDADVFLNRAPLAPDATGRRIERQLTVLEARVEEAVAQFTSPKAVPVAIQNVSIWGVPFARMRLPDVLHHVEELLQAGQSRYFITANLNYCMLTDQNPALGEVNEDAAFIVCDGMPIVWRSWFTRTPLPERVAGSELIYALTQWAAHRGRRIFFLGGAPGVAQRAADRLSERYPRLQVAGVEAPPFREPTEDEEERLLARIRRSQADLIYVALGQPKGELWLHRNRQRWGRAIAVQLGASFDFVAGGVPWCSRMAAETGARMGLSFSMRTRTFGRAVRAQRDVSRQGAVARRARPPLTTATPRHGERRGVVLGALCVCGCRFRPAYSCFHQLLSSIARSRNRVASSRSSNRCTMSRSES